MAKIRGRGGGGGRLKNVVEYFRSLEKMLVGVQEVLKVSKLKVYQILVLPKVNFNRSVDSLLDNEETSKYVKKKVVSTLTSMKGKLQRLEELVKLPKDEIISVLVDYDSGMDPKEAATRLVRQDTFQELKSNHSRKKENYENGFDVLARICMSTLEVRREYPEDQKKRDCEDQKQNVLLPELKERESEDQRDECLLLFNVSIKTVNDDVDDAKSEGEVATYTEDPVNRVNELVDSEPVGSTAVLLQSSASCTTDNDINREKNLGKQEGAFELSGKEADWRVSELPSNLINLETWKRVDEALKKELNTVHQRLSLGSFDDITSESESTTEPLGSDGRNTSADEENRVRTLDEQTINLPTNDSKFEDLSSEVCIDPTTNVLDPPTNVNITVSEQNQYQIELSPSYSYFSVFPVSACLYGFLPWSTTLQQIRSQPEPSRFYGNFPESGSGSSNHQGPSPFPFWELFSS